MRESSVLKEAQEVHQKKQVYWSKERKSKPLAFRGGRED
jgi:hypothetical protein